MIEERFLERGEGARRGDLQWGYVMRGESEGATIAVRPLRSIGGASQLCCVNPSRADVG